MATERIDIVVREDGSRVVRRNLEDIGSSARTGAAGVDRMQGALGQLKTLMAAFGLGAGINELIKYTDTWANLQGRLALVTDSYNQLKRVQTELFAVAQRTRSAYEGTADLYARIARSTQTLNASDRDRIKVTEAINKAIVISGASSESANAAIIQLGQGFASGTLRGDELNSVLEQTPRLAQSIAEGMGKTVGQLRAMGQAGLLTSEQVFKALLQQGNALDSEFAKMPQTIGQSFTLLKNEVLKFVGSTSEANGVAGNFAAVLSLLAANLNIIAGVIQGVLAYKVAEFFLSSAAAIYKKAAAVVADTQAMNAQRAANIASAEAEAAGIAATVARATADRAALVATQERVVAQLRAANADIASSRAAIAAATAAGYQSFALRVLREATGDLAAAEVRRNALIAESAALDRAKLAATAQLTAATAAEATATTALAGARSAATGAAALAGRALAFLGGPIGLITLALGLGVTAWSLWGNKAVEAEKQVEQTLSQKTEEIVSSLDKQIAKLKERNQLAHVDASLAKGETPAAEQQRALVAEMNRVGKDPSLNIVARTEILRVLGAQYNNLSVAAKTAADEQDKLNVALNGDKHTQWLNKHEEYMTKEQRLAKEIADAKKELGDAFTKDDEALIRKMFTKNDSDIKKEASTYDTLIASIRSKIGENKVELAIGQTASESQKMQIKLDEELASGKTKLGKTHLEVARAALVELAATETALKQQKAQQDVTRYIVDSTRARNDSAAALGVEYKMYGKTADARAYEMVVVKAESDMQKKLADLREQQLPISDQIIAQLASERDARVLVEQAVLGQGSALKYATQLAEENRQFSLQYITDEKARGFAALQIDAGVWQERIRLAGEGTQAQKLLQEQYDTWYQNQLLKPQLEEQKKMWSTIETTAHDTFVSIFNSGKSAFDRLRDTLKNGLLDLLYQMTLKKWIVNVAASATGGTVQSAAGNAVGSMAGNAATSFLGSSLMNAGGSTIAAAGSLFGSSSMSAFGAGFAGNAAGTTMGAAEVFSSAGMAAEASAASLGATVAAAVPYVAAFIAAIALAKSLDHSGTPHIGGASSASASGVSTIRAEDLNFERTQTSKTTEQMTAGIASGIVSMLDSTALAFGKIAGYTAATAFADDSSKDGAWGGLVISKLGNTLLNWQDSRGNGPWAPKVFADGAEGQQQYLDAVAKSVRTTLDDIGLPDWAKKMLNGLGDAPTLDQMAQVVANINATQTALKTMGDRLVGFANLSDEAATALINAAGGIENLSNGAQAYYDNFYTDAEKNKALNKQVADALAQVGLQMPTTIEGFRALVEAEMALGAAGAPAVATLLGQAGAFAQMYKDTASVATTATDKRGIEIKVVELSGDKVKALAMQRADELAAMDSSLRGLQQQVYALEDLNSARDDLQKAYDDESSRLVDLRDKFKELGAGLRDFLNQMQLGDMSNLSPEDKYGAAKAQFDKVYQLAKAGDPDSMGKLQQAAQDFLSASKDYNATGPAYGADYETVRRALENTANIADTQVSIAQQQLDRMDQMVKGILDSGTTVKDFYDAFKAYVSALNAAKDVGAPVSDPVGNVSVGVPDSFANQLLGDVSKYGAQYGGDAYYLLKGVNDYQAKLEAAGAAARNGESPEDMIGQVFGHSNDYWKSVQSMYDAGLHPTASDTSIPGYAVGGSSRPGLAMVGEHGRELVNFDRPGMVYTAGQTESILGGNGKEIAELAKQIGELKEALSRELSAANTQRGAGTVASLEKLDAMIQRMEDLTRATERNG